MMMVVAAGMLAIAGVSYGFTSSDSCPLEGTPECPKVNCPLAGTPDCPLENGATTVLPCCKK